MIYTKLAHSVSPIPLPAGIVTDDLTRNPYEIVPGHLTGLIINGDNKHKIIVFSIYLDCHDKHGDKNEAIRYTLGLIISSMNMPFVIMGDWQYTPEQLAETGWLEIIDGYIVAPDEPTCKQSGRKTDGSIIDYAVVSNWVAPKVVYIRVLDDMAFNLHKMVEMGVNFKAMVISEC